MLSPLGPDLETTWHRLTSGESAVDYVKRFDPSGFSCQVAAQVGYDIPITFPVAEGYEPGWDRAIDFGLLAIRQAMLDANLDPDGVDARFGLVSATHGNALTVAEMLDQLSRPGDAFTRLSISYATGVLTKTYVKGGPAVGLVTACSSGAMALVEAARLIEAGYCDAVVAGGTDCFVNEVQFTALDSLEVLSPLQPPGEACRPFDRSRAGFVIGEGACYLVLERPDAAQRRGAPVHGYLTGWAADLSLHHVTASCPDGECQGRTISRALSRADRGPSDVDYINAHGTGTLDNDSAESRGIRCALGDSAEKTPVSSTKAAVGHLIAAAGSAEAAFCLKAIGESVLPPTLNLSEPGRDCDLDYVARVKRAHAANVAVSNSFGLGGSMVSVVLEGRA